MTKKPTKQKEQVKSGQVETPIHVQQKARIVPVQERNVMDAPRQISTDPISRMMEAITVAVGNPEVDVEKMERMLDMHERLVAQKAEREFYEAMNRLQPKLPIIKKTGMIKIDKGSAKQETPYALLEDIEKGIRPFYTAEGFSTSYNTEYVDGKIVTILILSHTGGHKVLYRTPPMPLDTTGSKNNAQAAGSTMSYGQRYALKSAFNVIVEGLDDDGNLGNPDGKKDDKFAEKAHAETTHTPTNAGDDLAAAAILLKEKINQADTVQKRGQVLMQNIKLIGALEAANLKPTADEIRKLAETEPKAIDGQVLPPDDGLSA